MIRCRCAEGLLIVCIWIHASPQRKSARRSKPIVALGLASQVGLSLLTYSVPKYYPKRWNSYYRAHTVFLFSFRLISGNKKLVLKIGEEREDSYGSRVDVYFNLREGQVYPLGLYMGCEVEITWLYVHKTQKTGRLYCTSTVLTAIRLLKMGRRFGLSINIFNVIIYSSV